MEQRPRIRIVHGCRKTGPEAYGISRLDEALTAAGVEIDFADRVTPEADGPVIVVARADHPLARTALHDRPIGGTPTVPTVPQSTFFSPVPDAGRNVTLISGSDSTGLMYALLEVADRVRRTGLRALEQPHPFRETPAVGLRGVDRFITSRLDHEWFHSDEFWEYFLDRLASSRINRFVLITGFDTAYMSPPYPYLIVVPEFSDARVAGLDEEGRAANLNRVRAIGRLCAERGIEFFFGIWQQVPWEQAQSREVEGLPADEDRLAGYCAAGMRQLLASCPEIDGVQLRVNHESGVGTQITAEEFWNTLTDAVAECGRPVKLDLRAKGLTDRMIDHAVGRGLDVSVPTKYWCEQTGLPHHLTQMRTEELTRLDNLNHARRYSYSNLLRRPRSYDMIYRLWNLGATNLFLWGDPDYVKRFCASLQVGDPAGFEIACPLSLKYGHEVRCSREPWPLFEERSLVGARFEDERYWYLYLLFGRIGYSPAVDADVLDREFAARFGKRAGPAVAQAYAASARIVPLITAAHMPCHPMLQYWPELSTGGALFAEHNSNPHFREVTYGSAEPSDPGLFSGIDEYAAEECTGGASSGGAPIHRYTPLQVRSWLLAFAEETRAALAEAESAEDLKSGAEWNATVLDFSMLSHLADYHGAKILSALHLSRYRRSGAATDLRAARVALEQALEQWRSLAKLGTGTYHEPLDFQAGASEGRVGHWNDGTGELEHDLARLEQMAAQDVGTGAADVDRTDPPTEGSGTPRPSVFPGRLSVPERVRSGHPVRIDLVASGPGRWRPILRYRHTDQTDGAFHAIEMTRRADRYTAVIPAAYVTPGFDLLVYATARRAPDETLMAPGLYHPDEPLPYLIVRVE